jgi:predicted negative regulator of RcsB-dependent stress response
MTTMAAYDLEEQEQLDELKTWWKQYGNLVTAILLAVAVAAAGWQGWNWYQRNQAGQASAIYTAIQQAAGRGDAKRTKELAGELIDKYSGSMYAAMGVLVSARVQIESGDTKTARAQLEWAADKAGDESLRDLARLRLAIVLLDEKAYDEAAKQLARDPSSPFLARFGELRGDLAAAQGKAAEARTAYEAAMKAAEAKHKAAGDSTTGGNYREMLRAKLEQLGGAR